MTATKPRTKKPDAEVVGSFENVMQLGKCTDGRSLFEFRYVIGATLEIEGTFVLAASELQAWIAMHSSIGVMEKMTKDKMSDRYKRECLQLMEERDAETETKPE